MAMDWGEIDRLNGIGPALSEHDFVKRSVEGEHPGGTPYHSLELGKEQLAEAKGEATPSWYAEADALNFGEAQQGDKGVEFADYGKSVMGGGASLVSGAGWALERLGADTVGGYLRDLGRNASEYWRQGMTREAQEELGKELVTQDEDGEYHIGDASWNTVGLSAAGSLLGTAAGMGVGGVLTKGLQLIPGMNNVVAGMLGYGSGEGAIASASAGEGVDAEVMSMTHDQLLKSPAYVAVLEQVNDPDKAKEVIADAASGNAAAKTFVGTAILSAPMGALVGKFTSGLPLATTRPRAIATGALGEASQEFGQSGYEQIASNQAIRDYADPEREVSEGVVSAAVSGAAAGGIMGGAFGFSGKLDAKAQAEKETAIRESVKERGGDDLDADIAVAADKVESAPVGDPIDVVDTAPNLGDLDAPSDMSEAYEPNLGDLAAPANIEVAPLPDASPIVEPAIEASPVIEPLAEPIIEAAQEQSIAPEASSPFPEGFNANAQFDTKSAPIEETAQPEELTANEKANIELQKREKAKKARKQVNPDKDSITRAIAKLGGIKTDWKQDITRGTKNKFIPGVGTLFSDSTGTSPDDMASQLQQHGYLTEEDLSDNDAYTLLTDKITDELGGNKHYAIESKAAQVQLEQAAESEYKLQLEATEEKREAEYKALELKHGKEAGVKAREYDDWLENHSIATYDNEIAQYEKTITEREQDLTATTSSSDEQLREIAREAGRNEEADNQATEGDIEELTLTQETESQRADREKAERKDIALAKKAQQKEDKETKQAEEAKAEKQAIDNSVHRFELGQDAAEQVSGQKDIFNLPKKPQAAKTDLKPMQDVILSRKAKVKELEGVTPEVAQKQEDKAPSIKDEAKPILTKTKAQYIRAMAKDLGLKKGSPGYEGALTELRAKYDDDLEHAEFSLPFSEFKELEDNKATSEESLREIYNDVREELGIKAEESKPDQESSATGGKALEGGKKDKILFGRQSDGKAKNSSGLSITEATTILKTDKRLARSMGSGLLEVVRTVAGIPSGAELNSVTGYGVDEGLTRKLNAIHDGLSASVSAREVGNERVITLNSMRLPENLRGGGLGSRFLTVLTAHADKTGSSIALTAAGDFGGSKAGQVKLYKRFGFTLNKGKNKDYSITENMIRRPDPAKYSKHGRIQGAYLNGKAYIVAKGNTEETLSSVAYHELTHAALDDGSFLDGKTKEALFKRLDNQIKLNRTGRDQSLKEAVERTEKAGTSEDQRLDEVAAYLVTDYINGVKQTNPVVRWVKEFIAEIKAAFIKHTGLVVGAKIDGALLHSIAKSYADYYIGESEYSGESALASKSPVFDTFFSGLARSLKDKLGKGVNAKLLASQLDNPSTRGKWGVKEEEVEWSGIIEWLKEKDGKVTKQEVIEFIEANQVQVEDVALDEGGADRAEIMELAREDFDEEHDMEEFLFEEAQAEASRAWGDDNHRIWRVTYNKSEYINKANGDEAEARADFKEDAEGLTAVEIIGDAKYEEYITEAWDLSKAEYVEKVEEREERSAPPDTTKYKKYTVKGEAENYRELLLTLPLRSESKFNEDKVEIKRNRISTTQGSTAIMYDGELMAEYDDAPKLDNGIYKQKPEEHWLGVAKKLFYHGDKINNIKSKTGGYKSPHFDERNILAHVRHDERVDKDGNRVLFIHEVQSDWHKSIRNERKQTPNAPFKGNAWIMLAMKKMIRIAAENGFDKVAWATGEQSADLYSLDKVISEVHYSGTNLKAYDFDGKAVINQSGVSESELEDYIGKEPAKKLLAQPKSGTLRSLTGVDLKVGGEGMRSFYDKSLPNLVNKYIKKWGTKTEIVSLEEDQHGFTITDKMRDSVMKGQPLFSREATEDNYSKDSPKSIQDIANEVLAVPQARKGYRTRVKEWIKSHLDIDTVSLKQGLLDSFASIEALEKKVHGSVLDASDSAHKAALRTKNIDSVLGALMNKGLIEYKDGGVELIKDSKGFLEIFEKVADANLIREWELWAGAVRAKRLMAEGRENNYTKEQIKEVLSWVESNAELKSLFEEAQKDWQAFNRGLLDFYESAGLINSEERELWESDDYVPFNRVAELSGDTDPKGRGHKAGLSGQKSNIKHLEGGVEKISIIEAMVKNMSYMVDASFKNIAMQRIVDLGLTTEAVESIPDSVLTLDEIRIKLDQLGIPHAGMTDKQLRLWRGPLGRAESPHGTVSMSVNGRVNRFMVHDPVLLRALTSLGPDGVEGIMKVFQFSKRLLTTMVTSDPSFAVRNFVRDTASTAVISEQKLNPFTSAIKGVKKSLANDDTQWAIMAAGAGGGGYYDTNPDDVRHHLSKLTGKGGASTALHKTVELWDAYQKVLGAGENANRIAIYDDVIKSGGTKAEAAHRAQDILNFSRHGDYKAVQVLIQMVPFMNARVQGLERLYRGAKENPARFALKGSILMGATLALLAANWDNDDYWDLPEWARDTYYHFWLGGEHYRLPKPFEVGAIFSTIPERMFEQMREDADSKLLASRMLHMISDTFAMDITPQLFKPMIEVAQNKSAFTGAPIVSTGMQYGTPESQYTPYTSETMKALAEAMPDFAPEWMRSPVRLQHVFKGYLGTLGSYALMSSDFATRAAVDAPDRPSLRKRDVPIVSSFVRDGVGSTKHSNRVYTIAREVNQLHAAIRKYKADGLLSKARDIQSENAEKLRARKALNHATRKMSKISSQIKRIYDNRMMSSTAKRQKIDALSERRNKIAIAASKRYWYRF